MLKVEGCITTKMAEQWTIVQIAQSVCVSKELSRIY